MLDLILSGGSVVLKDEVARIDIGIKDGKIALLQPQISESAAKRIDASGLHIMPGMVDVHVHFNEPGMGHWEGFAGGSAALAAGGCTTYADMPLNGLPPTVSTDALYRKLEAARAAGSTVDFVLWGGLMPGHLDDLESLARSGVIGFKAFMSEPGGDGEGRFERIDDATLYEGMRHIAALGRVLALHAEDETMVSRLSAAAVAEGRTGMRDYAASRPIAAECAAVGKALELAAKTGCPLHFVHISSAEAVDIIEEAKRQGIPVTVETCPHYLTLCEDDFERLGTLAKCAPPLRTKADQDRLWQKVIDGRIDMIASDHSPCPPELKRRGSAFEAWGGIAGAQSSLELMVDEGHLKRGLPLPGIAQMLALNPARRFGLHPRKGEIAPGADADLALLDLRSPYTLAEEMLKQRHKCSPYVGRQLGCRVAATYSRGQRVYDAGSGEVASGTGSWIPV
ncbi:allantoinase [Paenibacillus hamazuiensis]|uniref:allantoinase n=1 Tax=Paenibacillus hamazuiensis TaxID=2936508 RepID=UPI00200F6235|nr:allantoinase [Paenibacillus hamazuiensis]